MSNGIRQRALGSTGLSLSEIGLGAAPLGNLYRAITDAEARLTLNAALDAGITYLDTAPYYGFGLSEQRIGAMLGSRPGVVMSTKVGRLLRPLDGNSDAAERDGFHSPLPFTAEYDYTHAGVMRSWESSRQRLGRDAIDVLLVHDIGSATHGDLAAAMFDQLTRGGGFRALEELRAAQLISAFGLGVNESQVCLQAMDHARLDVILLAGRYTLLEQGSHDALLPACERQGVAVVAGGVFNSGILATGVRTVAVPYYNYAPAPSDIINRVRQIQSVCDVYSVSLPAAALQFVLAHPVLASAVLGLSSEQQVSAALAAYDAVIPADFWVDLKTRGLLRGDAPVPVVRSS